MKKIVTTLLTIITICFLIFIGYWVIKGMIKTNERLKESKILGEEIEVIYDLDWNTESIDMNIKSTGESGKLEKIIKEYYQELYQYRKEYDSTNIYNLSIELLNAKNLKTADLNVSKQTLIDTYEKNRNTWQKIVDLIDNDYILALIENKRFDKYYIDLYKDLMISEEAIDLKQKWIDQGKDNTNIYESTIEALNILNNNKNAWHIENDKLYFYNEDLKNQYNELIEF